MNIIKSDTLDVSKIWTIYTKSNCIYCLNVKELLKDEQVLTIINCDKWLLNNNEKQIFIDMMKDAIGYEYKTFPMVFLNDKFIGGYDDTKKYIDLISNTKIPNALNIDDDF